MTKLQHRASIALFVTGLFVLVIVVPLTLSVPGGYIPVYLLSAFFFALSIALAAGLKWKLLGIAALTTALIAADHDFNQGFVFRAGVERTLQNIKTTTIPSTALSNEKTQGASTLGVY